jgi:hypothetical protein
MAWVIRSSSTSSVAAPGEAVEDVAGEQARDVLDGLGTVRLTAGPRRPRSQDPGVVAHGSYQEG